MEDDKKVTQSVATATTYNNEAKACENEIILRERRIQAQEMLVEKKIPTELVDFVIVWEYCNILWRSNNYVKISKDKNCEIHFYLDDYQFERLWVNLEKYIDILYDNIYEDIEYI